MSAQSIPCIVATHQKISDTEGGFDGILQGHDQFGCAVALVGDLDDDGTQDLVVGVENDHEGGIEVGAVWILFLGPGGTVSAHQKINGTQGGFTGDLDSQDTFGCATAGLGDLDGDATGDLAVGAFRDDDGAPGSGAVWILFLNPDGTVQSHQKISDLKGGLASDLKREDRFGWSLAFPGDLSGDSVGDLVVGALLGDGPQDEGAIWSLFLDPAGTVNAEQRISEGQGGFEGALDEDDHFGSDVAALGNLDGAGLGELAVGAEWDNDGGFDRGAVWILFLADPGCPWDFVECDADVGITDLLALLAAWGQNPHHPADFDGDGEVDLLDLLDLLNHWGPC